MNWDETGAQGKGMLDLEDVGGFYERDLFSGANGTLELAGLGEHLQIRSPAISVALVNPGFEINNIDFALDSDGSAVLLRNFSAELLGGRVSQRLIRFDPTRPSNEFALNVENIQLDQVLQLEADIRGQGSLSGTLPVALSEQGVTVSGGKLIADAKGGIIRYQSQQPLVQAAADSGFQFALDALRNFHYKVLDIGADYAENGDLKLAVRLEGRNPDLESARPVHFNLTINENLPALLKSLQLSQEISDKISRRLQRIQEQGQDQPRE